MAGCVALKCQTILTSPCLARIAQLRNRHLQFSVYLTETTITEKQNSMRKNVAMLAAAALLVSTGIASAQSRNYDSSGAPKSSGSSQRSGGGLAENSTTGSAGGMTGAPSNPNSQAGDAGASQAAPPPGPDNGGTLNPRAPSNAR